MNFTVKTEVMQKLVIRAEKGASNNKLLPLTSFLNITHKDGVLRLDTTDMTNYVSAMEYNVPGEDFNIVVALDSFSKIVSKTTSENITLELTDKSLKFIGNGTYNIALPVNEEGELIKFPMYNFVPISDTAEIEYSDIKSIIASNKACIANDMSTPALTYYYCGDEVISANQNNICLNNISLLPEPIMISNIMMDLIGMFGGDKIYVQVSDDAIRFSTANYVVYGRLYSNIEEYPAEPIEAYLTAPFAYNCKFNKDALIGAMDRLVIFTDKLDDGTLNIKFTDKYATISNKNNTSFENVGYLNTVSDVDYVCAINYELFKSQIVSNSTDIIDLYFGDENDACIKIVDGEITKITSLQEM